jgi:hypothetical protein
VWSLGDKKGSLTDKCGSHHGGRDKERRLDYFMKYGTV